MIHMSPSELAAQIGEGLLSFPVTHFNHDRSLDEGGFRQHIAWLLQWKPTAVFAAGGTGEFFSLSPTEVERVVKAGVEEVRGAVPVVAGCGYGVSLASESAGRAEAAGADGILLLPPYLVNADQEGLVAHITAVCKSTTLGVIYYSRDNAVLDEESLATLCDRCPNLIGYKDGIGDFELLMRVRAKMGDRLVYIGGVPTAETVAIPYLDVGINTYSSAIFNFLPGFAQDFYAAVQRRDHAAVSGAMKTFILPYLALRNRGKGYAVSIVKAGLETIGRSAGPVRPPLRDLTASERGELSHLVVALLAARGEPAERRKAV
ncbi:MAG: 5-dehydro-4-deoxyglucarate dehydratase [Pseudorhodoplanes sp.]|uniref:5-dehydro-4-deoxyglucarate dehydratase n=1 Tax=Pseudorhodoplanes sp. TaxID=1934341 RepID=UPI003D139FA9